MGERTDHTFAQGLGMGARATEGTAQPEAHPLPCAELAGASSWEGRVFRAVCERSHILTFDYCAATDEMTLFAGRVVPATQRIASYLASFETVRAGTVHPESIGSVRRALETALEKQAPATIDYRAKYAEGSFFWCRATPYPCLDEQGSAHLVGAVDNVERERALRMLAEYDAMTGLANHATAEHLIDVALSLPDARTSCVCAVIDIDDFKKVNDSRGHLEGDTLLRKIGAILRASCERADIASRIGGDEFVLLLKGTDLERALAKLESISASVRSLAAADGTAPTVSMGVFVPDAQCSSYRAAIARADQALYEAKRSGKNRICVYRGR